MGVAGLLVKLLTYGTMRLLGRSLVWRVPMTSPGPNMLVLIKAERR